MCFPRSAPDPLEKHVRESASGAPIAMYIAHAQRESGERLPSALAQGVQKRPNDGNLLAGSFRTHPKTDTATKVTNAAEE